MQLLVVALRKDSRRDVEVGVPYLKGKARGVSVRRARRDGDHDADSSDRRAPHGELAERWIVWDDVATG